MLVLALAGLTVAGGIATAAVIPPGTNGPGLTSVGPVSATDGFPVWYKDKTGLRLENCISQADPLCPARGPLPDETAPISFPDNYPDEGFYSLASANLNTGNNGKALLDVALEQAFRSGPVVDGDQITFARLRLKITNATDGVDYKFTTPVGVKTVQTSKTGLVFDTEDIGIGGQGDFTGALGGRIGPFLEDPLSGPGFRSFEVVQPSPVPTVSAFQGADPALATGSPFDGSAERSPVFDLLPGGTGPALAGYHHIADTKVGYGLVDRGFAVPAVGGHGPRCPPGPGLDPLDGGRQLRGIRRVPGLHVVVQDDAVVVVDNLPLVTELDRFAEPALRDRPGLPVVQTDHPGRPVRGGPGDPLPGLTDDPLGRLQQVGQVIHRSGQPTSTTPRGRITNPGRGEFGGLRPGPAQRPAGVDQQPLGVPCGGLSEVGELTGDPLHAVLDLVTAQLGAGPARLQVFDEERGLIDALWPPLPGGRPAGDTREHDARNVGVVMDDVQLGGAGCQVKHPLRAGHLELVAGDREQRRQPRSARTVFTPSMLHQSGVGWAGAGAGCPVIGRHRSSRSENTDQPGTPAAKRRAPSSVPKTVRRCGFVDARPILTPWR